MSQNRNNSYSRGKRRKKKRKSRNKVIAARLIFVGIILVLIALLIIGLTKILASFSENIITDTDVSTVTVLRNGKIKQTIVEDFNPGFYDEKSLEDEIESRIEASDGKVESEGFEISDGVATLRLKYDSDEAMAAFNDQVFYADTIDALLEEGISFDSNAIKAGGSHAVIVSETMDVRCPKKILYTGGTVTIDEDDPKLAHCTADDGQLAFVIY